MILFLALALALATVPLAGGRLSGLAAISVGRIWAVSAALVLQVLVVNVVPDRIPGSLAAGIHLISYALGLWFLLANHHLAGMRLVVAGGLANLAAIAANDGVMPARSGALVAAGRGSVEGHFVNSGIVAEARLAFLGDVFAWPEPLPLANVFSIGDVLLVVGVAVLAHVAGASRLTRAGRRTIRTCGPEAGSAPVASADPTAEVVGRLPEGAERT